MLLYWVGLRFSFSSVTNSSSPEWSLFASPSIISSKTLLSLVKRPRTMSLTTKVEIAPKWFDLLRPKDAHLCCLTKRSVQQELGLISPAIPASLERCGMFFANSVQKSLVNIFLILQFCNGVLQMLNDFERIPETFVYPVLVDPTGVV